MTKHRKIVVVGGVAGGAGAATKARRIDERAEIVMFEKGPYVSFANCGIPYYLGGQIPDRDNLFLVSPERFSERFNITVKVEHEVTSINRDRKTVTVKNLQTGEEFEESYDELILAPGARPVRPPLPGIELGNIFTLTTVPDADAIKEIVAKEKLKRAVVVGSGFIGLEAVEAFLDLGMEVTVVEKLPQLLPALDPEMASYLDKHLREKGVTVVTGTGVSRFLGEQRVAEVELENGQRFAADIVVLAIGVRPRTRLAEEAGLKLGESGGLLVNERMQTSDPDIYAAGDIVESVHLVSGNKIWMPLAGPANKQARVAGMNAAGGNMAFRGVLGAAIIKVCGVTAAKVGLLEKDARQIGLDYFVSYTHSQDHAGYYPGAEFLTIKLVVCRKTGKVLGGQIVGAAGVDKRIDVLATAIYAGLTVEDLENLDLAYSPPYSSAKDPVIIAGLVAANIYRGEVEAITGFQLAERMSEKDIQIVDVRTPAEYRYGHIPGAVNHPVDGLRNTWQQLDPQAETVVYCAVGYRSYLAYRILKANGFKRLKNLSGGIKIWLASNGKMEKWEEE